VKQTCLNFSILIIVLTIATQSFANEAIGYFKKVNKAVSIVRGEKTISAKTGDSVCVNDIITTDHKGTAGILLKDDTRLSIGPDTELLIDKYIYNPSKQRFSFISKITEGTLLFISGKISKRKPESVKINTPLGTIGIRGTRFLVKIDSDSQK